MDGCRWLQTAIATAQTEGLPTPHNLKIVYRFLLSSNLIKKKKCKKPIVNCFLSIDSLSLNLLIYRKSLEDDIYDTV